MSKVRFFLSFSCLILWGQIYPTAALGAGGTAEEEAWLEQVYRKLIQSIGDKSQDYPPLKIVDSQQIGVAYHRSSNQLLVEKKIMEVCQNMGADQESAMAFLLAHELTHFYQKHNWQDDQVGFLFSKQTFEQDVEEEKEADVYGAFISYLSGFDIEILPNLIKLVYQTYNIRGNNLDQYPSLSERQQTLLEAEERVGDLIRIYETAHLLFATGQYSRAALCYEYLLNFVKCKELYGNLGAAGIAAAAVIPKAGRLSFIYPLSVDLNFPLRDGVSFERDELIAKAVQSLQTAIVYDPQYFDAVIHLACAFDLTEQYEAGLSLLESVRSDIAGTDDEDRALLIKAIITAHQNKKKEAGSYFTYLKKSTKDERLQDLALQNANILRGKSGVSPNLSDSRRTESLKIDSIDLTYEPDVNYDHHISLGTHALSTYQLSWSELSQSYLVLFEADAKWVLQQIDRPGITTQRSISVGATTQQISTAYGKPGQILFLSKGYLMTFPDQQLIFQIENDQVIKWSRYSIY